MKLQKLVYFTHGWWLAINGSTLLNERPQLWRHGPVFASLYHSLKLFGHNLIPTPQSVSPLAEPSMLPGDNYTPHFVDWVWGRYGHLSSFALSDMTHRQGTSWSELAKEYNYQVPRDLEIPDEYVRREFLRELANEGADGATVETKI